MTGDDSAKLDSLVTSQAQILVQLATVGTKVDNMREQIISQGVGHADHEARLRQHWDRLTPVPGLVDDVRALKLAVEALQQWRWSMAGIAGLSATLGGGAVAAVVKLLGVHG